MSAKHTPKILPPLTKPLRNSKRWDGGIEWGIAGERAARLEREDQLREALECKRELLEALKLAGNLFAANHAISQFDWGRSVLRAEDIRELNEVPLAIRAAIARAEGGQS